MSGGQDSVAGELWTAARIAKEFHFASPAVARSWLKRSGIAHVDTAGPRDARLYPAEVVLAARRTQLERGKRRG